MSESGIITHSSTPDTDYTVRVGIVLPILIVCDVNICAATFVFQFTRETSTGATSPTGNLRIVFFADSKPIECVPIAADISTQSIAFTTTKIDGRRSLLVIVDSDVAADIGLASILTLKSINESFFTCCRKKH